MRIARVATMQGRESSNAYREAIMSTEIADKGRPRTSAFVGIRISFFYFAFWAVVSAIWAASFEGRCLFECRVSPSIQYICEHAPTAFVRMQCELILRFPLMPFGLKFDNDRYKTIKSK